MESTPKPRLLSLYGCESFDRFKIEVVVEMEIVEVLAMDQQIKHVKSLSAYLKSSFNPV
jgi:hypothetical protein